MRLSPARLASKARRTVPGLGRLRGLPLASTAVGEARLERDTRRILASGIFDRPWYELQAGREFAGDREAVRHYLRTGRRAGLGPHPLFEPEWFRPEDWRTSRQDPLMRYLTRASDWKRHSTSALFSGPAYLQAHPKAARHPGGPLGHFAASATEATPFPFLVDPDARSPQPGGLQAGETAPPATWGQVRAHLERALAAWAAQDALRRAPRRSPTFDRGTEAVLRAEAAEALATMPRADVPLVSVVMPVWNRAALLRRAVASVQAQTLTDWELVVVDDGSTDDTPNVLEGISTFDQRVRVVTLPRTGVSGARNRGIAQARGRYVAFLDSDNTWDPDFLATAVPLMHARGLRAAYAAMELHDGKNPDKTSYRAFDGGREHLAIGNHVDLNVLVVEAGLLREVGGFAEDLRRTVDYDLVLKLSERCKVAYLAFVGAVYAEDRQDDSRISVSESLRWDWVVRSRHIVDWPGADAAPRMPGRTSIVLPVRNDAPAAHRTVGSLLAAGPGCDVDVILVDSGSRRSASMGMAALELLDPRVRVHRSVVDLGHALATDVGLAEVSGEHVVLADAALVPEPGWLAPLAAALDESTAAAAPVVLTRGGTVEEAGMVFSSRSALPVALLRGHPLDDVHRLGTARVGALEARMLLARTDDVIAARGYDCLLELGWHAADLSRRLVERSGRGRLAVVPDCLAWRLPVGGGRVRAVPTPADDAIVVQRWADVARPDVSQWTRAGFEVAHHATVVERTGYREVHPVVVRPAQRVGEGPAQGLASLRWAIKIAAPAGPSGRAWGDWHFAHSLSAALTRLGQQVVVDTRECVRRPSSHLDDVELVLRGLDDVEPDPAKTTLLWVISHPDDVAMAELSRYDAVFAASLSWSERMTRSSGVTVEPLLQCTDPTVFHPDVAKADSGAPVLFIGNSRGVDRPVVRHAVDAGVDVHVYGGGWAAFIDPAHVRGRTLPGEEVARSYRSASVVLNDHWDDMRREGFLSNRLFDVTAAGGRLLSDDVAGAEELFGGSVRTWGTGDELVALLKAPLAEVFADEDRLLDNAARIAAEHSFDARARRLLEVALERR